MQLEETRTPFTLGTRALTTPSLRSLADELPALYARSDERDLPRVFVELLARLLPGESHDVVIHDRARDQRHWYIRPATSDQDSFMPAFFAHLSEFAPVHHRHETGTGEALALSDFIDAPGMDRLGLYRDFYRPLGLEDDLSVHIRRGDVVLCASVMRRRRGFTTVERELMNALRPHFKQVWSHAAALASLRAHSVSGAAPASEWHPEPLEVNFGLTPREAEVLLWVAQGKTNPEVATILGMRPDTARTHLAHIFTKLGVETRHAASLRAMEVLGLPK